MRRFEYQLAVTYIFVVSVRHFLRFAPRRQGGALCLSSLGHFFALSEVIKAQLTLFSDCVRLDILFVTSWSSAGN